MTFDWLFKRPKVNVDALLAVEIDRHAIRRERTFAWLLGEFPDIQFKDMGWPLNGFRCHINGWWFFMAALPTTDYGKELMRLNIKKATEYITKLRA